VASAKPYASLQLPAPHHSVFTGRMPFLPPNQQCQSTEVIKALKAFKALKASVVNVEMGCYILWWQKQAIDFQLFLPLLILGNP